MQLLLLIAIIVQAPLPAPTNIRVHDGDTVKADFTGLPAVLGHDLEIRLDGIDAPELHDHNPVVKSWAYAARDYLTARVKTAKHITLSEPHRDKYFRLDAKIFLDGVDIQQELISKGYAKPYNGGAKIPWTPADVPTQ